MSHDAFDKKVKQKIAHQRDEIDTDALWAAIEPLVQPAIKPRRRKRWGLFLLLLLPIGCGICMFDGEADLLVKQDAMNDQKPKPTRTPYVPSNTTTTAQSNTQQGAISNTFKHENIAFANELTASSVTNSTNAANAGSTQKGMIIHKPLVDAPTLNAIANTDNEIEKASNGIESTLISDFTLTEIKPQYLINQANLTQRTPSELATPFLQILSPKSLAWIEKATIPSVIWTVLPQQSTAQPTPRPNLALKQKPFQPVMRFDFGAGLPTRQLSGGTSTYQTQRDSTESLLETVQVGLLAGIQHQSNFYALTGLQYYRINERFERIEKTVSYSTNESGIVSIYYTNAGDTIINYLDFGHF
jgi:hypothetical protein